MVISINSVLCVYIRACMVTSFSSVLGVCTLEHAWLLVLAGF